uniref:Uncharacterized protein n=1 Tax=Glossina austeni TaxID=7395 RepID=A0A1A9UT20_GLOAU
MKNALNSDDIRNYRSGDKRNLVSYNQCVSIANNESPKTRNSNDDSERDLISSLTAPILLLSRTKIEVSFSPIRKKPTSKAFRPSTVPVTFLPLDNLLQVTNFEMAVGGRREDC